MSSEWKPGDVGMVPFAHGDVLSLMTNEGWILSDRAEVGAVRNFTNIRPLVVIDPEDREQVERLLLKFARNRWDSDSLERLPGIVPEMQAALREFAKPTPPKPEEPTGLGAVVRDSKGDAWVRTFPDGGPAKWRVASLDLGREPWSVWSAIDAVEILSAGWSE